MGMGDADFAKVRDALEVASYVEQLHLSEQQWLMNRLSWLFTSQSFCILAYVTLITRAPGHGEDGRVAFLKVALPLFGVVCCAFVGLAIRAANADAHELGAARVALTVLINERLAPSVTLPRIGPSASLRDKPWTLWVGGLPHNLLPWLLMLLWLSLLTAPWLKARIAG